MTNPYNSPWAGKSELLPDLRSQLLTQSYLRVAMAYSGKTLPNGSPAINGILAFAQPLEVFGAPVQAAAMLTQGLKGKAIEPRELRDFPAPISNAARLLMAPAGETTEQAEKRSQSIQRSPMASALDLAATCNRANVAHPDWHGDTDLLPDLSNPLIRKAYLLACVAHKEQKRRTGEAFINHPLRVARRLADNYSAEHVATALLHDVIEDTLFTVANLKMFPKSVIEAVVALTKKPGEYYPSFVIRASKNPMAAAVKLADITDNSSREQLVPFSYAKRESLTEKYEAARLILVPTR